MANQDYTGEVIGGCRLDKKLGQGGMGSVYLATQLSLERPVALKILSPELAQTGRDFIARFRREARAVATLGHPGVIEVHDMGEDQGFFYIIMEFADGGSLTKRIA